MKTNELTFTAIDFETANGKRTSACAVGLVRVERGVIVEEKSFLLKPRPNYFFSSFIDIHHITPDMVADAPCFGEIWSEIRPMIEEVDLLVAHNASFDMSVLKACIELDEISAKLPTSACTVRLSKRLLPYLPNHKLNTVCAHYGIELNHHEALSDARGCAKIMIELEKLDREAIISKKIASSACRFK
jgi:DNA polymerase-3 subunit epsilon